MEAVSVTPPDALVGPQPPNDSQLIAVAHPFFVPKALFLGFKVESRVKVAPVPKKELLDLRLDGGL
jgi:hypothetical protein